MKTLAARETVRVAAQHVCWQSDQLQNLARALFLAGDITTVVNSQRLAEYVFYGNARVERAVSGPRRKRGRTDTADIPPQAFLHQSSNGGAGPPEGDEDSSPAPDPGRPDEEDAPDTESVTSDEVDAAEIEAPGGADTTVVLRDEYASPPACTTFLFRMHGAC